MGPEFAKGSSQTAACRAVTLNLQLNVGSEQAPGPTFNLWENFIQKSQDSGLVLNEANQRWLETIELRARETGNGVHTARQWASGRLNPQYEQASDPIFQKLATWILQPKLRGMLIKRSLTQKRIRAEALENTRLLTKKLGPNMELEILSNPVSSVLGKMLKAIGGASAALVDEYGSLVAATEPWILADISDLPEWSTLKSAKLADAFFTPSYKRQGGDFRVRKIALPILGISNNERVGWLLVEIYAGPENEG